MINTKSYDDVLNQHRHVIFTIRHDVLKDSEQIYEIVRDFINAMVQDMAFGKEEALRTMKDLFTLALKCSMPSCDSVDGHGHVARRGWRPCDYMTGDHCLGRKTKTTCCVWLCALGIGHWHWRLNPSAQFL